MVDHPQKRKRISTPVIMAVGFLVVVMLGAALLMLPISSKSGTFTDPLDAFFTAVSATCVTGLVTLNTAVHWSIFGQAVILAMIQIGGLGFMTFTVLILLLVRRKITPKERMMVAMSYNLSQYNDMGGLIRRIVVGTLTFEVLGAVALYTQFVRLPHISVGDALWRSVFTSISAFCNAGFDLMGEVGMGVFMENPVVNITLILLITIGGVGFIVWSDVAGVLMERLGRIRLFKRKRARDNRHLHLSVYTKLVLILTSILLFGGALVFALVEWNNPQTIGNCSPGGKILGSLFHACTLRTAGFAMFDNAGMREASYALSVMLMFIGGASGSTAGGVKVVTMGVLLWSVFSVAFGRSEPVICKRRISKDHIIRAVSVVVMQLLLIFAAAVILSASTSFAMQEVVYEVVSAISTVGLTLGITPMLPWFAKLLVMLLMYFGRVGVLTITYAVMENLHGQKAHITYPDANMLIG